MDRPSAKITIRRHDDGWHVTRPAFGFGAPTQTVHGSHAAALASLQSSPGSAGPLIERGDRYTIGLNVGGSQWRRPRWIDV